MSTKIEIKPESDRELVICRILEAPVEAVYRAWTDPSLMIKWFTPAPWTTIHAETDVRAGGSSLIVMKGPDGTEMPNRGIYLEVVPNQKLVFTDAFTRAWVPSENAFMVVTLTFQKEGERKTRYTARAVHWTIEGRKQHEQMGFHEGWGKATDQLEELASKF
jgi:uncharacterized protein YndB with AHSA1/START domain